MAELPVAANLLLPDAKPAPSPSPTPPTLPAAPVAALVVTAPAEAPVLPATSDAGGRSLEAEATVAPEVHVPTADDEPVASLRRALLELQRRVEGLERRSYADGGAGSLEAAAAAARSMLPGVGGAALLRAGVSAVANGSRPPLADARAIERQATLIEVDVGSLDGSRRRRRNVAILVVLLLVAFGGLATALARSWAHTH